ncbi:MAG: N-6 DNA methylase [Leptospirillum sp.]
MSDRTHRDLSDDDLARITNTYHNWREDGTGRYEDGQGFSKSASLEEVRPHGRVLTPGDMSGQRKSKTTESRSTRK